MPNSPSSTRTRGSLWKSLAGVGLLFILSLLLRLDTFSNAEFGEGVAKNVNQQINFYRFNIFTNQEVSIHNLFVMQLYDRYSVSDHLFGSYIGFDPQFLQPKKESPLNGIVSYYTSFPPTVFIATYLTLKAFRFPISHESLQLFNLALHLITSFLIFFLVRELVSGSKKTDLLAILGSSVYIFSTGTLHNHLNVYWSHQLLQPFLAGALLLFLVRNTKLSLWQCFFVGLILSIITWTGALYAGAFFLFYLYSYFSKRDFSDLKRAGFISLGTIFAFTTILAQTILVTGASLSEYIKIIIGRISVRSFNLTDYDINNSYAARFKDGLFLSYGMYILIGLVLIFYVAILKRKELQKTINPIWIPALFISFFPLWESVVLLQHDSLYLFSQLKFIFPLIIILSILSTFITQRAVLITFFSAAALAHGVIYLQVYTAPREGKTASPNYFPAEAKQSGLID